jgi:hypothetical protein
MIRRVKFKQNTFRYGQDFREWEGIPTGIWFDVVDRKKDYLVLVAPGYGGKPYGNGSLYFYTKQSCVK